MARAQITSSDVETASAHEVDLASTIKGSDIERHDLESNMVSNIDNPVAQEYLKDLKFMEDEVTIVVGETTDKNAEDPVPASVNGEKRLFSRGVEYKVARKFVDSLIKAEESIQTVQYKDAEGVDQTKVIRKPALKYPLSIINDPAGEVGRRWFQHQSKNAW